MLLVARLAIEDGVSLACETCSENGGRDELHGFLFPFCCWDSASTRSELPTEEREVKNFPVAIRDQITFYKHYIYLVFYRRDGSAPIQKVEIIWEVPPMTRIQRLPVLLCGSAVALASIAACGKKSSSAVAADGAGESANAVSTYAPTSSNVASATGDAVAVTTTATATPDPLATATVIPNATVTPNASGNLTQIASPKCDALAGNWYLDNGFGPNLARMEFKPGRLNVHTNDDSDRDSFDIDGCEPKEGKIYVHLDRDELGLCVLRLFENGTELSFQIGCGTATFPIEPNAASRYVKR